MKTDLDRLFPTKRGGKSGGQENSIPASPWQGCQTILGGGIKSLSDKDLGAAVPCQTHFGEVWRGGEVESVESAVPTAPVAERSLFDDLATPPVAQPVEATAPAATIAPAAAAPVEPTPGLAPAEAVNAPVEAAPVTAPAADAPPVELPPGWPADLAAPPWWGEFTAALDTIWLLSARRQQCGDPACRFPVTVEWAGVEYPPQWACPACGRAADPVAGPPAARPAEAPEAQQPAVEVIEWRYPTAARPGFRVKPRACGWCGPHTEWWQDSNSRWRCVRCDPPAAGK
jgi:hypothetical protein